MNLHSAAAVFLSAALHVVVSTRSGEWRNYYTSCQWKLGEGGCSSVYLAKAKTDDTYVAIKQTRIDDKTMKAAYIREVEFLSECKNSECIIKYKDHGQDGQRGWMAMEWAAGGSLEGRLLEYDELQYVAFSLLTALQYCHSQRLAYMDLKPSNVVVVNGGAVKLCDFGSLTRFNHPTLGIPTTTNYSPEQDDTASKYSDSWSLGQTICKLWFGTKLHCDTGSIGWRPDMAVRYPLYKRERRLAQECTDDLHSLIKQLTATKSHQRISLQTAKRHPFFDGFDEGMTACPSLLAECDRPVDRVDEEDEVLYVVRACAKTPTLLTMTKKSKQFVGVEELHVVAVDRWADEQTQLIVSVYNLDDYCSLTSMMDDQDLIDNQRLLISVFVSILKALQDIHSKGFLHLDVHPDNIVIHKHTGAIKLLIPARPVVSSTLPNSIRDRYPLRKSFADLLGDTLSTDTAARWDVVELCVSLMPLFEGAWQRFLQAIIIDDSIGNAADVLSILEVQGLPGEVDVEDIREIVRPYKYSATNQSFKSIKKWRKRQ